MKKYRAKEEWIQIFKRYESDDWDWDEFLQTITHIEYKRALGNPTNVSTLRANNRNRFIRKYNEWKLLDNKFMEKKKKHKRTNGEVNDFIKELTREELEEIARVHIRENEKSKNKNKEYKGLSATKRAFILNIHRTTLYKVKKQREYKFDYLKELVMNAWNENLGIYGRRRLAIFLLQRGIEINERTLGRYLSRWGLITKTRKARRKSECKNTKVKYRDLVKRNYNPLNDNIIATDVSYIPANVKQNNVYLSVAISHKTKMIESWELSERNDNDLVIRTIEKLKRKDFILHSDHGSQYSSVFTLNKLKHLNIKTSMGRVGNSLDNREVEYFFGCLKGEYLKFINTGKMSIFEIRKHINKYIDWYNTKRIQSRLQWKTPTEVSAYAV